MRHESNYGHDLAESPALAGVVSGQPALSSLPKGLILVAPLGAPIPEGAADLKPGTGTLYQRLEPMTRETDEIDLVLLSGQEIDALTHAWTLLLAPRPLFVLTGLPGQLTDVLFDHAAFAVGWRSIPWPEVQATLLEQARATQRAADVTPDASFASPVDQSSEEVAPAAQTRGPRRGFGPVAPDTDQDGA